MRRGVGGIDERSKLRTRNLRNGKVRDSNFLSSTHPALVTGVCAHQPVEAAAASDPSAHNVDFEVDWSFLENLASLGCGHFFELGMSKLVQVLMENMMATELAPRVTDELNKLAPVQRDLVQQQDPQQRPHQFTRVAISPEGIDFRLCPS
jgi:hypothetical protein